MSAGREISADDTINLTPQQRETIRNALNYTSTVLYNRMRSLTDSNGLLDICECLTAAVYLMSSPSTLRYVSKQKRLQTFIDGNWDALGKSQTMEEMVESGFFYLNEDDHVKCFFCDLGLKDWDQGDHPEREHVKFSPLCFFLKSSRGLHRLREMSERPPNYPTSYLRQDHNQLLRILGEEFTSRHCNIVCNLGFSDSKVLLCVSRKFIRFRQRYTRQELVIEMQREWDREMQNSPVDPPQYECQFDLASVVRAFHARIGGSQQPQQQPQQQQQQQQQSRPNNKCRKCGVRDVEIVCLPCGHLSLCHQCSRITRQCPAVGCGAAVDNFVRAFVS